MLQDDTYIDDIVTGCSTREDLIQLKYELIHLLKAGGFDLRKWASNDVSILNDLPSDHLAVDPKSFTPLTDTPMLKVLGLQWSPSNDVFCFEVHVINDTCVRGKIY